MTRMEREPWKKKLYFLYLLRTILAVVALAMPGLWFSVRPNGLLLEIA